MVLVRRWWVYGFLGSPASPKMGLDHCSPNDLARALARKKGSTRPDTAAFSCSPLVHFQLSGCVGVCPFFAPLALAPDELWRRPHGERTAFCFYRIENRLIYTPSTNAPLTQPLQQGK